MPGGGESSAGNCLEVSSDIFIYIPYEFLMYIYIYTIDEFDISILTSYQLIVSIDFF